MSGFVDRLRVEWRQRRHHPAFRIPPPAWEQTQRAKMVELLDELDATLAKMSAEEPLDNKSLAGAATNLWRARRRLAQRTDDGVKLARQTGRLLRTCQDALTDAGLVVRDHDGETFHPGRSLEALAFNDDPELTTETVTETVRPSIYLRDQRIQMGQVIVGCPVKNEGDETLGGGTHA